MYSSFVHEEIAVDGAKVALVRGGTGQPLLLLHGFPETRAAWHRVAPTLAERFTLVIPDLPGYGDSIGTQYSKRAMARARVRAMRALGHEESTAAAWPTAWPWTTPARCRTSPCSISCRRWKWCATSLRKGRQRYSTGSSLPT